MDDESGNFYDTVLDVLSGDDLEFLNGVRLDYEHNAIVQVNLDLQTIAFDSSLVKVVLEHHPERERLTIILS